MVQHNLSDLAHHLDESGREHRRHVRLLVVQAQESVERNNFV